MPLRIRALENVGVEVLGFDINDPIDEALREELEALWLEHAILLFRDQDIDAKKQIEFSAIFGELERHPLEVHMDNEHPELFVLESGTQPQRDAIETSYWDGVPVVGRLDWHMDLHYTGKPNRGALLRAVTIAEQDGTTGFGDLAKAYDALDVETQQRLEGLEVTYVFEMQRKKWRYVDLTGYAPGPNSPKKPSDVGFPEFADSIYPAVVTHPVDTIKSNLQGLTAHRYSGNLDCARQIIREKGFVNGLYLGIKPRVVRVVIENAILFSVFEVLSRRLDVEIPKWAYLGRGGSS